MPKVQDVVTATGAVAFRPPRTGDMGWSGTVWRRWDGRRWSKALYSLHAERLVDPSFPDGHPTVSESGQAGALSGAIEDQIATHGATVVFSGPSGTILGYPRAVSHVLHGCLSLVTAGLWSPVWLACVLSAKQGRVRFEVDRWGHVWAIPLADAR